MLGAQSTGCLCRLRWYGRASLCETSTVGATFWSWRPTATLRQGPSAAPVGPVASYCLQVGMLCTRVHRWRVQLAGQLSAQSTLSSCLQAGLSAASARTGVPSAWSLRCWLRLDTFVSDSCSGYQWHARVGSSSTCPLCCSSSWSHLVQLLVSTVQALAGVGKGGVASARCSLPAARHQLTSGRHCAGVGAMPQPAAGNSLRRLVRSLSGRKSGPASPTSPAVTLDAQPGSFIEPREHGSSWQPKELAVSLPPQCPCLCISCGELHLMVVSWLGYLGDLGPVLGLLGRAATPAISKQSDACTCIARSWL